MHKSLPGNHISSHINAFTSLAFALVGLFIALSACATSVGVFSGGDWQAADCKGKTCALLRWTRMLPKKFTRVLPRETCLSAPMPPRTGRNIAWVCLCQMLLSIWSLMVPASDYMLLRRKACL